METRVLSGPAATAAIARVTWTRALRTRTLFGACWVALLPVLMAAIFQAFGQHFARGVIELGHATAAVLCALLVAGAIGEEFEDRTMTYLWSRPLPRWTVITGKLVALAPLSALVAAGGVVAGLAVSGGATGAEIEQLALAMVVGSTARAALAAAIATLVPRQAVALTIAYLFFFDAPLAVIPARLQALSIWFHEGNLAGAQHDEHVTAAVIGLAAISAAWLGVALWRVRRIE